MFSFSHAWLRWMSPVKGKFWWWAKRTVFLVHGTNTLSYRNYLDCLPLLQNQSRIRASGVAEDKDQLPCLSVFVLAEGGPWRDKMFFSLSFPTCSCMLEFKLMSVVSSRCAKPSKPLDKPGMSPHSWLQVFGAALQKLVHPVWGSPVHRLIPSRFEDQEPHNLASHFLMKLA